MIAQAHKIVPEIDARESENGPTCRKCGAENNETGYDPGHSHIKERGWRSYCTRCKCWTSHGE